MILRKTAGLRPLEPIDTDWGRLRSVDIETRLPGISIARRREWRPAPYDAIGLAVAVPFVCLSLTPSLLPRGPIFQGWLSGIVAAAGYGLGALTGHLVSRVVSWRPGDELRTVGWAMLTVGGPTAIGGFLVAARGWQREAHRLVGQEVPGPESPVQIVAVMLVGFVALVSAGRLARRVTVVVAAWLSRHLPVVVAGIASVVLVALGVGTIFDQVILRVALTWMDRVSSATNNTTAVGVVRPVSPERSGSAASRVAWADLGLQGRNFVSDGPTTSQLTRFAGRPAKEPIRVYVGLESASDARQRARLAVAELERTGAFDRAVLCVVTTTGTGWVDERAASALEYLYAGNTAIVATQYSYLPSTVSFVFDDNQVQKEGAELFKQIHAHWSTLPPNHRPRLLIYGESLGSNGGQAAFAGLGAIRASADGALFVGPPSSNRLWHNLVTHRDPGSPERLPVYQSGASVRFAADEQSLQRRLGAPWRAPRVLFLQHASDPIVWWSPQLLLRRPAWLTERRGKDVSPSMSWYPIVTFWQVTADLVAANGVPAGSGHRYGDLIAAGWAAVAPPDGWTAQDTDRLRRAIE
jgi:uncharacterized membrane protein